MQSTKNKRNAFKQLNLEDRIKIEMRYCIDKWSTKRIAEALGRSHSTIIREIGGTPRIGRGKYQAQNKNDEALKKRGVRGRKGALSYQPLYAYIKEKLTAPKQERLSPQLISLRLVIEYPHEPKMRVSHEAIYEYIYSEISPKSGLVKKGGEDLRPYLHRRHRRREKRGVRRAQKLERKQSLPSIHNRPEAVLTRTEVGHWEDDLIVSSESLACLKTITERVTRVHLITRISDKTIESGDGAVRARLAGIPSPYCRTLTRDRGTENLGFRELEQMLGVQIYFADAYRSCQRGTNENANGLTRWHFPKKTDFASVSDQAVHEVEYAINTRPRTILGGYSPCEVLYRLTGIMLYPDRPESVAIIS